MTLNANSQGVLSGSFTIPAGVPAGNKLVEFVGAGGSHGEAVFSGQGTLLRQQLRTITVERESRWFSPPPPVPAPLPWWLDPLAQTFTLTNDEQIGGVDLWFVAKGASDVTVQLRTTTVGFPDRNIVAEKRVKPADIVIVGSTRIAFDAPVSLRGGQEYALVVLSDDADAALAIAELGKWDSNANKWVSTQAYNVGVLLSSSNASTWTAHQDKDLAFRLLRAKYSETNKTISLGNVAVNGATDLMLLAYADAPSAAARVQYTLSLPDGSAIAVADGQPVRLSAAATGNVGVSATLRGDGASSPVFYPGAQLVAGAAQLSADYVTIAIPAGSNSRVRVIYDATLPSGAAVAVKYSGIDAGDSYADVPQIATSNITSDKVEHTHEISSVNEASVRVKLTLTGTASARPLVENLRVIVM
jgi:hypothetical protein